MLKKLREKLKWFDPFTYVDLYLMPKVNPKESEAISWVVYLASSFIFAWIFYTALGLALGTSSPMVIVLSGSMEPLYHRGDVIVMQGSPAEAIIAQEVQLQEASLSSVPLSSIASLSYSPDNGIKQIESIQFNNGSSLSPNKEGSVVVYYSSLLGKPIIHRAVAKLKAGDGWYLLTKGDSEQNSTVDQDCGKVIAGMPEKPCIARYPVPVQELEGKAMLWLPFVGCFKLWLIDDLGSLIRTGSLPADFAGVCYWNRFSGWAYLREQARSMSEIVYGSSWGL